MGCCHSSPSSSSPKSGRFNPFRSSVPSSPSTHPSSPPPDHRRFSLTGPRQTTGVVEPSQKERAAREASRSKKLEEDGDDGGAGNSSGSKRGSGRSRKAGGEAGGGGGGVGGPKDFEYEEVQSLLTIPYFEDLETKQLKDLRSIFSRRTYQTGEFIIRETTVTLPFKEEKEHKGSTTIDATSRFLLVDPPQVSCFHVIISGSVEVSAQGQSLYELSKGEYFGHTVIRKEQIQPVTVQAKQETVILYIPTTDFDAAIKKFPELSVSLQILSKTEPQRIQLRSLPFFADVSEMKLQLLGTLFEVRKINEGSVICEFGSVADGFYYIVQGRVEVTTEAAVKADTVIGVSNNTVGAVVDLAATTGAPANSGAIVGAAAAEAASGGKLSSTYGRFRSSSGSTAPIAGGSPNQNANSAANSSSAAAFSSASSPSSASGPSSSSSSSSASVASAPAAGVASSSPVAPPATASSAVPVSRPRGSISSRAERMHAFSSSDFLPDFLSGLSSSSSSSSSSSEKIYLATLNANDYFGEISLLQQTRRTATCTASTDCILLFLSRTRFDRFLKLAPEVLSSGLFETVIKQRTGNSLKGIPIFAPLKRKQVGPLAQYDEPRLAALGQLFQFQQVEKNQVIFREGDVGDSLYIIVRGTCMVTAKNEKGEEVFLSDLGQNSFFGEASLIHNVPCNATVTSTSPCIFLRLPSSKFRELCRVAPEIEKALKQRVSERTAERLRRIPFFSAVKENKPWSKLDLLGGLFIFEEHSAGSVIFTEGSLGDKFYIITSGTVEVRIRGSKAGTSKEVSRISGNTSGPASVTGEKKTDPTEKKTEPVDQQKAANVEEKKTDAAPAVIDEDDTIFLNVVSAGSWFGEIALMLKSPRTASVRCITDCVFLSITSDKFQSFLSIAPELVAHFKTLLAHRTVNTLKDMDLFQHVQENKPWSKLEVVGSLFSYEQREAGQKLYSIGDEANRWYLLMNGKIQITTKNPNELKPFKVKTMRAQCHFGAADVMRGKPRSMTVTALERCVFLYLSKESLNQFLSIAPELKPYFASLVQKRVRESVDLGNLPSFHFLKKSKDATGSTGTLSTQIELASPNGEEDVKMEEKKPLTADVAATTPDDQEDDEIDIHEVQLMADHVDVNANLKQKKLQYQSVDGSDDAALPLVDASPEKDSLNRLSSSSISVASAVTSEQTSSSQSQATD